MWPQYVLSCFICWHAATGVTKIACDSSLLPAKRWGGSIGILLRYATILWLLYEGGFYN